VGAMRRANFLARTAERERLMRRTTSRSGMIMASSAPIFIHESARTSLCLGFCPRAAITRGSARSFAARDDSRFGLSSHSQCTTAPTRIKNDYLVVARIFKLPGRIAPSVNCPAQRRAAVDLVFHIHRRVSRRARACCTLCSPEPRASVRPSPFTSLSDCRIPVCGLRAFAQTMRMNACNCRRNSKLGRPEPTGASKRCATT
jgi:hypothetical protein